MPDSPIVFDRPKRKAMFLSPTALEHLRNTASRRRTERAAMEEALALLAQRDAQLDAMQDFVKQAHAEWGLPTDEERVRAAQILAAR